MTTPTPADVTRLRREAAHAQTSAEQTRLIAAAENAQEQINATAAADREVDLGAKLAAETLTPAPVHELNTSATDWLGHVASSGTETDHRDEMSVQADLWYDRCHVAAKADDSEFATQARGMARHHAGAYGENADAAETTFLRRAANLRQRDIDAGRIQRVATSAAEGNAGPSVPGGVGGAQTSSERAQNIEVLERSNPGQDVTPTNDPGLGETHDNATAANGPGNPQQDVGKTGSRRTANGGSMPEDLKQKINDESDGDPDAPDPDNDNDNPFSGGNSDDDSDDDKKSKKDSDDKDDDKNKKESSMPTRIAACPACQGRGRVAVRHEGVSGLDQIDQTVDPHDNGPKPTPYPQDVAFPWMLDPANVDRTISETEQQLQQRDKLKGASRQAALAHLAAMRGVQAMHRQQAQAARRKSPWAFIAGQDDSGWIGDMGAGGVGPGQQDGGNPGGPNNIAVPDPVYGYGGDTQSPGQNKPFGADEANDRTNQPPNWQIGQPTQMDQGTVNPAGTTGPDGSPPFPNQPMNKSSASLNPTGDPEIAKALEFVRQRQAALAGR